jgi:hypothetical protein
MKKSMTERGVILAYTASAVALLGGCVIGDYGDGQTDQEVSSARNATGTSDSFVTGNGNISAPIDRQNAFFKSLGTNGRTCESCHQASQGFTVTPAALQARFDATGGKDPVFRLNDGANSPLADVSTVDKRRAAYSMLLGRGVIRVGIGMPANADFDLVAVDDPHGFASATELSLFRRPLPTTDVSFLATVMWDGRESLAPRVLPEQNPGDLLRQLGFDLTTQAGDATLGHAQATSIDGAQMSTISAFEQTVYTAQIVDDVGGRLDANGATGGAANLAKQDFYVGINDVLGADPRTHTFDPNAFTLFDAWKPPATPLKTEKAQRQYSIFRGQQIFNTKPIAITGVKGLNDLLNAPVINGTCTTCHDTPNVGNHSVPLMIDIGVSDESRRTAGMPLYTFRSKADGTILKTTDPGRGLITGKFTDLGKFKGPVLRAAASRPPYFHNGMAADLDAVVDFYATRFGISFTGEEHADLVAFLQAL